MQKYYSRMAKKLGLMTAFFLATMLSKDIHFHLLQISYFNQTDFFVFAQAQKKKVIYVDLMIGVETHKKIRGIPEGASFGGDFKKITSAGHDVRRGIVRFVPKKEGIATMTIMDANQKILREIRITVTKSNLSKVAKQLRKLLGNIEGIQIKIVNSKVVVDGEVILPREKSRIVDAIKLFPGQAKEIVRLSPLAAKKIAKFIERDINNPEIHVRSVNKKYILEGWASDKNEKQRAEIIAKTYVPDELVSEASKDGKINVVKLKPVINLIKIKEGKAPEPGKIVKLIVHYVEMQKDYERSFRFQWMPDLNDGTKLEFESGGRSPGGVLSTITGTISNLLPKLNWAKQHGHARVLQSSSLMMMDNQKGDLRSVVRVPYLVAGPNGTQSTNFEEAGMITTVTPKVLGPRSDSVQLQLDFAVKSLLSYTPKGPLISDNHINTVIVVRSGQSAAIGGLISSSSGSNYNKLPADVSKNPIISLYASKDFRRNQSQFVVFVTPIIESSASNGAEQIKRKFRLRD